MNASEENYANGPSGRSRYVASSCDLKVGRRGSSGACLSTVRAALGRVFVWCVCDVANLYCVSASVRVLVVVERASGAQCALKSALFVGQ